MPPSLKRRRRPHASEGLLSSPQPCRDKIQPWQRLEKGCSRSCPRQELYRIGHIVSRPRLTNETRVPRSISRSPFLFASTPNLRSLSLGSGNGHCLVFFASCPRVCCGSKDQVSFLFSGLVTRTDKYGTVLEMEVWSASGRRRGMCQIE